MRAQVFRAFGGSENFELTDIAVPEIRPGMMLVACRHPDRRQDSPSRITITSSGTRVHSSTT